MIVITTLLLLAHSMENHGTADGFTINPKISRLVSKRPIIPILYDSDTGISPQGADSRLELDFDDDVQWSGPVRAPLKSIGPYIGLGLVFPELATVSQRARNATGIALDFVLDTAANINTINAQVARELQLEVVDEAPGGVSAGGPMEGGHIYRLGSCQLEGIPEPEQFTFMENLTASALPVASPAAAGLLSLPFFHCFDGGIEFDWRSQQPESLNGQMHEQDYKTPSVTFYGTAEESAHLRQNMTRISIEELPVTHLPMVKIEINGVTIPALFDTGSPITVMNAQAAEQAGVKTVQVGSSNNKNQKSNNLFGGLMRTFQRGKAMAQAAARGDILAIAGTSGERVDLIKSESTVELSLISGTDDDNKIAISFGNRNIYVGNIPGLAALNGLVGDGSPPAAVLGLDVMRSKPKMLLVASNREVYF